MKITLKMRRGHSSSWGGAIGNQTVTACPSDVAVLFAMGNARNVTCEISNARPRGHEDYHTFSYNKFGNYAITDVTFGSMPSITRHTSTVIRNAFLAKKQKTNPIYVSFY